MIDPPHVTETSVQTTAVIRFTIPRGEIRSVMGPGYKELMDTVAAQGISTTGPWFTHHLRMQPETFDFELGVPVSTPVVASGRVQPSRLPASRVARTIYHGGYEGLGQAWGEFTDWIAGQGLKPAADLWECYVDGPGSHPDPTRWRTELNRPLSGSRG